MQESINRTKLVHRRIIQTAIESGWGYVNTKWKVQKTKKGEANHNSPLVSLSIPQGLSKVISRKGRIEVGEKANIE